MLLTLLFSISALTSIPREKGRPDAETILKASQAKYSKVTSYKDAGSVYIGGTGSGAAGTFTTSFDRSGDFRFHFGHHEPYLRQSYWIIRHNGKIQVVFQGKSEHASTLDDAISDLVGVSFDTCLIVPKELLPRDVHGFSCLDLRAAELLDDEVVFGAQCYRIQGTQGEHGKIVVDIDKGSLVIRKVMIHQERKDYPAVQGISTSGTLNLTIIYHSVKAS